MDKSSRSISQTRSRSGRCFVEGKNDSSGAKVGTRRFRTKNTGIHQQKIPETKWKICNNPRKSLVKIKRSSESSQSVIICLSTSGYGQYYGND